MNTVHASTCIMKVDVANLLPAAVSKADHGLVNILVKHFVKFRTKLVNPRSLLVVCPSIIKHQLNIITELKGEETRYHGYRGGDSLPARGSSSSRPPVSAE